MFKFIKPLSFALLISAFTPMASYSDGLAGAYLSGTNASLRSDYKAAHYYFERALSKDPENGFLLHNAMLAALGLGDVDKAAEYAKKISQDDGGGQLRNIVLLAKAVNNENYDSAVEILTTHEQQFTTILHGLMLGWSELGRGKMGNVITAFDGLDQDPTLELFGQYHKALALAAVGDFETADKILTGDERGNLRLSRVSLLAHVQIMAELDKKEDALALIDHALRGGRDIEFEQLRDAIVNDTSSYSYITDAKKGAAEVFLTLAGALSGPENQQSSLLYARIAQYLRPDDAEAPLLVAEVLRELDQYDLAIETYAQVATDHPQFLNAEFGRADALVDAGKTETAIEVLRSLTRTHGDNPRVHMTLGDVLRGAEKYTGAREAYDTAIAMIDEPAPNHWFLFYAVGIANERLDNWPRAEMNFNRALELAPNQPLVLNYLGYSLVEKNQDLERAQKMIEDAVAGRPNSGFITDSLGWVRYRLGKFEEAVEPMETAVELLPDDPVVNDHLGDVYWMVGRQREAEFQWRRAMSFDPTEEDAMRIRAKLDRGLDAVLEEEQKLETQSGAN